MSMLPAVALLSAVHATDPCPSDVGIRTLKRHNSDLLDELLDAQRGDGTEDLEDAVVRAHMLLGCTDDIPPSIAARSFLLLGAHHMQQGDEAQALPFISAAALLGGQSSWIDDLGEDLKTRFLSAVGNTNRKGVVMAPEFRLSGGFHLVGSSGSPPWTMPAGTFTFEWGERSVPINVNAGELTVVLPRTFDEFDALVEGVTEADLLEPDYGSIVYYDSRREARKARKAEKTAEKPEQESQQDSSQTAQGTDAQGKDKATEGTGDQKPVDAESFFDELADMDSSGQQAEATAQPPPPPDEGAELSLRPHISAGAAWTVTGEAAGNAAVGTEDFGGLGVQAGLGLVLRFGKRFCLRPELGFRSASTAPQLGQGRFEDEGYSDGIPVEPLQNRLLLGYARLPALLSLGPVRLGAAPSWSMGAARVTGSTTCGDEACIAPSQGRVMALGGSGLLGFRFGRVPVLPWFDFSYGSDGDRPYIAASVALAWEGSP